MPKYPEERIPVAVLSCRLWWEEDYWCPRCEEYHIKPYTETDSKLELVKEKHPDYDKLALRHSAKAKALQERRAAIDKELAAKGLT